jgi:uncharacterized protein
MECRSSDEVGFLADAMLGRLARWLRVLGFDTAGDEGRADVELVRVAAEQGRILLTRDRRLVAELRPEAALLVTADEPLAQLRCVIERFGLRPPAEGVTRCLVCNAPLRAATAEEAAELVPPRSRELPGPVRRCPECGRVYWPGSHARRMRESVERAFASIEAPSVTERQL